MIEDILEDQKKYDDIRHDGFEIRLIGLHGESCTQGVQWNAWAEL